MELRLAVVVIFDTYLLSCVNYRVVTSGNGIFVTDLLSCVKYGVATSSNGGLRR